MVGVHPRRPARRGTPGAAPPGRHRPEPGVVSGAGPVFVSDAEVRELLPVSTAIAAMREVMRAFSTGEVTQPVRTVLRPPARGGAHPGLFGSMPAHVPFDGERWFGIKSVVVREDNPARGLPTHVGTVTVFAPDTGLPVAVLPADTVTELRTAAVSAVAVDALALPGPTTLAIAGAGAQARAHVAAVAAVRPVLRVRLWSRRRESATKLAEWVRAEHGLDAEVFGTPAEAASGAGVICTTTAAREPILDDADVAPGATVCAVGASQPGARELSSRLVAGTTVVLDSAEAAAQEASELLVPRREGLIGPDHPRGELGAVLAGEVPGRGDERERIVYLSLGLAAQDVATAVLVAKRHGEWTGPRP
ncbi:ornithine cyclodeaminase family protein [Streptomyces sp. 3MP-14]|uniref:Ornithine cyclodeaminase family protein n=1 Tax=Streptomyces mimosae TaxID=2586635 RepID=A0A5N6ASC7_9ACTN|nr:ornithine cyclodeaminase family protein [Streptomyces mimosae]KAB8179643.1 ornithine cyclodeaminase family protein [Streptomyces sp. 3MP-14]